MGNELLTNTFSELSGPVSGLVDVCSVGLFHLFHDEAVGELLGYVQFQPRSCRMLLLQVHTCNQWLHKVLHMTLPWLFIHIFIAILTIGAHIYTTDIKQRRKHSLRPMKCNIPGPSVNLTDSFLGLNIMSGSGQ